MLKTNFTSCFSWKTLLGIATLLTLFQQSITEESQISTSQPDFEVFLPFAPCISDLVCNISLRIPFVEDSNSRYIRYIESKHITKSEKLLRCPANYMQSVLSPGSFALLLDLSLLHLHSQTNFQSSHFNLKITKEDTHSIGEEPKYTLSAEVCVKIPEANFCCTGGQILSKSDNLIKCEGNENLDRISPKIYFDGRFHNWIVNDAIGEFPSCQDELSIVKIGSIDGYGKLRLMNSELEFLWENKTSHKIFRVRESNYCVGQMNDYGFLRPVVAFCKAEADENVCIDEEGFPCFSKCCPEDSNYDLETFSCKPDIFENTWLPDVKKIGEYSYTIGRPTCDHYTLISMDTEVRDHTQLISDGTLYVRLWNRTVGPEKYCIDYFKNRSHLQFLSIVCYQRANYGNIDIHVDPLPYAILLALTSLFLMATMIAYAVKTFFVNDQINKTFNLSVISLVSYIILGTLLLAFQQVLHNKLSSTVCLVFAILYDGLSLCTVFQFGSILFAEYMKSIDKSLDKPAYKVALCLSPVLCSFLLVVLTCMLLTDAVEDCPVDALMLDPWQGFLVTGSHVLVLLMAPFFLFLTTRNHEQATTATAIADSGQKKYEEAACLDDRNGHDLEMIQIRGASDTTTERPVENDDAPLNAVTVSNDGVEQQIKTLKCQDRTEVQDRWWLTLKLWATFLLFAASYVLVFQRDALAFWVYADILVMLKCVIVAGCLVMNMLYRNTKSDQPGG